jgi:hypothetical protein
MNPSFFYFAALVLATAYFLRQMGRIAKAQEESAKHLYEIAWSLKSLAIRKEETERKTDKAMPVKPSGADKPPTTS